MDLHERLTTARPVAPVNREPYAELKNRVHLKMNETGEALRQAMTELLKRMKLTDYSVSGMASMFQVFFGKKPENYQEALLCNKDIYNKFWSHMLENGVFLPPSQFETCFLSTAHEKHDVEDLLRAFIKSCGALK